MTATVKTEVVGAKQAVKSLRKIDPELRKQFNRDVKTIAAPVVDAARGAYPDMPLSGMSRIWSAGSRQLLPWSASKARSGVQVKIDTSKRAVSVIRIQQKDAAASIFELAGKKGTNPKGRAFIDNLEARFGRAQRVLWPTYERNSAEVTSRMRETVLAASREVQKELG
jgi:hypothetical protein